MTRVWGPKPTRQGVQENLPIKNNKPMIIGGALAAAALLGACIAAYMLIPGARSLASHAFAQGQKWLLHGQMSVGQSLLYITLPVVGTGLAVGIIKLAVREYQRRQENAKLLLPIPPLMDGTPLEPFHCSKLELTRTQVKTAGIVIGALATLGLAGFLTCHFIPHWDVWTMQHLVQPTLNLLNHPLTTWLALTDFSIASGGVALMAYMAVGDTAAAIDRSNFAIDMDESD